MKEQEAVCKLMEVVLQKHHAKVQSFNLRRLLVWVSHDVGVDGTTIYDTETWHKEGVTLWDVTTPSDPVPKDLPEPWRSVYPLDSTIVNLRKETDLQPCDPRWRAICKEAEWEGDSSEIAFGSPAL